MSPPASPLACCSAASPTSSTASCGARSPERACHGPWCSLTAGRWRATPAQWATEPLTPAADPAREVVAPYATRDHRFTAPGLIGTLVYPSHAPALEAALLYWGQWLGVGQKTTMGFGSYVWRPS